MSERNQQSAAGNQLSDPFDFRLHGIQHWAVVLPGIGDAYVLRAETGQELADKLKPLIGTNAQVIPFRGWRWGISKGPNRYLLDPNDSDSYPLFDQSPPEQFDYDPDGSLA